jgi:hypothetical protein
MPIRMNKNGRGKYEIYTYTNTLVTLSQFFRVLRRIFRPKREKVAGGWRRLHSEELQNLVRFTKHYSGNQIKEGGIGGVCSTHGKEMRNAYNILVRSPEGKKTFERPRRRPECGIRMYLREIGWEDVDWMRLAQMLDQWRSLRNTVISFGFHKHAGNFLTDF